MGDSITVQTQLGDVKVHKMTLADYAELLKAFDTIPKSFLDFFKSYDDKQLKAMSNFDYMLILPGLLANSWSDLIAVVAVPTDQDAEFMAKVDLADAVDIVATILELNDLPRIIGAVKKMLALRSKMARPSKSKKT